ncbi:hypothetical protein C8J56DRAFT_1053216 [Mycena floridula]|nr:hypothetical protein C8J56DRAFT_1053216 [Mycena floridula]
MSCCLDTVLAKFGRLCSSFQLSFSFSLISRETRLAWLNLYQSENNPRPKRTSKRTETGVTWLASLPLELGTEILSHLAPKDLLQLSRATRAFRRFLVWNSALACWRAARANDYGVPQPPPGMSKLRWAHLTYINRCKHWAARVKVVDWLLRRRICRRCSLELCVHLWPSDQT